MQKHPEVIRAYLGGA
ncbi:hypothetical protein [uncultured Limnohabitans sp.]